MKRFAWLLSLLVLLGIPAIPSFCQMIEYPIIWMEAESFEDAGGWVNDPQFIDIMGSPYLLANGVDEPVEDAVTHLDIPTDGTYQLWVRCKNWLPEHSPGRFQVIIDGEAVDKTFGEHESGEWRWINGGEVSLEKGSCEVRLHDQTGWWGRCDALVLSADPHFQPSNELLVLEKQRKKYYQPYSQADETKSYDVVVVGGGLAGSAAAISAARHGASVVLIQDRPVLGGNASSEIDVAPGGDNSKEPLDPGETGIIEEFYSKPDRGFDHDWSRAIEKVVRQEPNIDLRLNTRAINVVMENESKIEAVIAMDVHSGKRYLFPGKIFIDCTGDGWIGYYAGAEYRQGREARKEFGESLAPAEADEKTMGNTLMVARFDEEENAEFTNPEWAYHWKTQDDFEDAGLHFGLDRKEYSVLEKQEQSDSRFTHGAGFYGKQFVYDPPAEEEGELSTQTLPVTPDHYKKFEKGKGYKPRNHHGGFFEWWVEFGGIMDTVYDAEYIRDELFRINLGLWNYVKNHDPEAKEKNKDRKLTWINYVAGKRESRRLIGDYILTQWDYEENLVHDDNVAYGGWGVDIHHPNGFWKSGPMYYSAYRGDKISIPYRTLYSKNIRNLYMAGRNISVSHVALGGIRVMRTTCLMGQAVGTAAALCVEKETQPRQAGQKHIHQIQQRLLKDGAYVMGQRNEDPEDLALNATASASSNDLAPDLKRISSLTTPSSHDLNMQRAVMFQAPDDKIEYIALYLRSKNRLRTPVKLTLRHAEELGDFSSTDNIATTVGFVEPERDYWVRFTLNAEVEAGEFYYVFLQPKQGIQWDLFPEHQENTCRAYGGPNWTVRYNETYSFVFDTRRAKRLMEIPNVRLQPHFVIDGFNRAVNGHYHSWAPKKRENYPQWLQLKWDEKISFNNVHITFQNIPLCAPSYEIRAYVDDTWETLEKVNSNRLRRNEHTFKPVETDRLRLVLHRGALRNPKDPPHICEIRVYNEEENQ